MGAADPAGCASGAIVPELISCLMPRWSLWVEGWLFRSPWFVLSKRGDPMLDVACWTDLLLSSGAGLVLQHARQWDGARGEGWLHTHTALVRVGAGPQGVGDSGPSHAWPQTSVPGTTVLQGWAAASAASPGAELRFQVFGAGSAERDPGDPCWAPPWSRLCLAGGQKQKTAPKGTYKLLSKDGHPPALHWARGELHIQPSYSSVQCEMSPFGPSQGSWRCLSPGNAGTTASQSALVAGKQRSVWALLLRACQEERGLSQL